jgi:hypothetical protein
MHACQFMSMCLPASTTFQVFALELLVQQAFLATGDKAARLAIANGAE